MARGHQATDNYHERKLAEVRRRLEMMRPKPNPMPASQVYFEENATVVRRLHCTRYNACLDLAFAARWPGFTCGSCPSYEPMSRDGHVADLEGIGALFVAIRTGR